MKIRGERECTDCGARWSYYETGEIACPDCGSLRSVGVDDDRQRHTDATATLELDRFREAVAPAEPDHLESVRIEGFDGIADDLESTLREYLRRRGFIRGGELLPLDDTFLAARELLEAVDLYARATDPGEVESLYVLGLLRGADGGDRPDTGDVPRSMREARGMAAALAVQAYREEVATYLSDLSRKAGENTGGGEGRSTSASSPDVTAVLGRVRDREKRIQALQGDVHPAEADALVSAARDLGTYLREDDLAALARAHDRLDTLE
ncbi:MAG: hypothetical protein V5A46_00380 [Haloferacaceae archaeon]